MGKILAGMNKVDSYINDLMIHTNVWHAHLLVLEKLFRRLEKAGLTAKPSNCVFEPNPLNFLDILSAVIGS